MGGYLITTASVNYIYKPIVCTIAPAWDQDNREWTFAREISIDAKLKREELSIDKKVGSAAPGDDNILSGNYNGAVGDNVLFKLTSDVPTYPANAINKKYVIADQLSGGLTFPVRPSNISLSNFTIKFFRDDQSEVNLDSAVPNIVTLGTKGLDGKTYTFALSFDMDKLQQHGVKKIEVSYIAKINKDAVVGNPGNPNDVLLQYSNNPYGDDSYKTKQDKVEVYTYGLRVLKVDAANKATVLPGAKFVLSTLQDGDNISGHMYFDKEEDGTYVPTGEMTPLSSTELVTDVDGLIKIKGLNEGTYYLHETEAPVATTSSTSRLWSRSPIRRTVILTETFSSRQISPVPVLQALRSRTTPASPCPPRVAWALPCSRLRASCSWAAAWPCTTPSASASSANTA